MIIKIPTETILIHNRTVSHGDYKTIGKTESGRKAVSRAIIKGYGDVKLVAAIVRYYQKKQQTVVKMAHKKAKRISKKAA